jgi:hypothetical protein
MAAELSGLDLLAIQIDDVHINQRADPTGCGRHDGASIRSACWAPPRTLPWWVRNVAERLPKHLRSSERATAPQLAPHFGKWQIASSA